MGKIFVQLGESLRKFAKSFFVARKVRGIFRRRSARRSRIRADENKLLKEDFAVRYLISYDISDDKVREKIFDYLESFAFRLQYSVFYCRLGTNEAKEIWSNLVELAEEDEVGRVLMAPLCKTCEQKLKLSDKPLEEEKGFLVV